MKITETVILLIEVGYSHFRNIADTNKHTLILLAHAQVA